MNQPGSTPAKASATPGQTRPGAPDDASLRAIIADMIAQLLMGKQRQTSLSNILIGVLIVVSIQRLPLLLNLWANLQNALASSLSPYVAKATAEDKAVCQSATCSFKLITLTQASAQVNMQRDARFLAPPMQTIAAPLFMTKHEYGTSWRSLWDLRQNGNDMTKQKRNLFDALVQTFSGTVPSAV